MRADGGAGPMPANSITLTPGTVSIAVTGSYITVHAIAEEVAEIERRPGSEFADVRDLVAGERGAVVVVKHGLGLFWRCYDACNPGL